MRPPAALRSKSHLHNGAQSQVFRVAEARLALSAFFGGYLGFVVSPSLVALIGFERFV